MGLCGWVKVRACTLGPLSSLTMDSGVSGWPGPSQCFTSPVPPFPVTTHTNTHTGGQIFCGWYRGVGCLMTALHCLLTIPAPQF